MASLFCVKWRHVPSSKYNVSELRILFTWRTILPNFIPIRLETTERAFWRRSPKKKNKIRSGIGSVPDPKLIQKSIRALPLLFWMKVVLYLLLYSESVFVRVWSKQDCSCCSWNVVNAGRQWQRPFMAHKCSSLLKTEDAIMNDLSWLRAHTHLRHCITTHWVLYSRI